LLFKYCIYNAVKRWDPVNSIPHFSLTKQLQLCLKKNAAAAAEPNGLLVDMVLGCHWFWFYRDLLVVLEVEASGVDIDSREVK
jgi:hypothetical protein